MSNPDAPAAGRSAVFTARLSLALLLSINLLNYIDRYVLAAVLQPIKDEFFPGSPPDAHSVELGRMTSAFFISYMLMAPLFGWLADRMSRWLLVGIGVLLWSGATAASGLAGTITILLVCRLFVGVGEAGYGPAAPTILSDLFSVKKRGLILAFFYAAIPVGSALGFVIGGVVAKAYSWRMAFYVVTVPGILLGLWSLFMKDPRAAKSRGQARGGTPEVSADSGPDLKKEPPARSKGFSAYLSLLTNRSYLLNTAAMTAMTFAIGGISTWMPKFLMSVHHMPIDKANGIFGAIVVVAGLTATVLGGFTGDLLRKKFGGSYFLVSGVAILISCPLLFAMTKSAFPLGWVFTALAVFFLFFNTGPSNTALANVVDPAVRATAFAVNIFVIHLLGDALSPAVLGWLIENHGWSVAFDTVIALMAVAGVLWLAGAGGLAADTDRATAIEIAAVR